MRVIRDIIILLEGELSDECPRNVRWGSSMVALYGPDAEFRGRLKKMSRCPEVLTDAGYQVRIVTTEEEAIRMEKELDREAQVR